MKSKKLVSIVIAASMLVSFNSVLVKADSNTLVKKSYSTSRIGGQDRYETSLKIANEFIKTQNKGVILADGSNFPDALSGSVLSKKYNAPVLLVNSKDYSSVISYIQKNLSTDKKIYLLGGTGVIKQNLEDKLKSLGYSTTRLGGQDRFQTNENIVDELNAAEGTPVVLVNGTNFPDALSISSIASAKGYPVLITNNSISSSLKEKLQDIKPSQVFIVGGTGVISDAVKNNVKDITGLDDSKVTRIGGTDRYDTSLDIAKNFNVDSDTVALANGTNFPDALSGSSLAAQQNAPLILVNDGNISKVKDYIDSTKYTKEIFLGSSGVMSDAVTSVLSKSVEQTSDTTDPTEPAQNGTIRIGNSDKFQTSIAISNEFAKGNSVDTAVLVSADDSSDSLSVAPLTKIYNAPVLITGKDELNQSIEAQIKKLGIKKVIIIGGTGVISDTVNNKLNGLGITTERLGGADKYETSMQIANRVCEEVAKKYNTVKVMIATTANYTDAMTLSPVSTDTLAPIILVKDDAKTIDDVPGLQELIDKYTDPDKSDMGNFMFYASARTLSIDFVFSLPNFSPVGGSGVPGENKNDYINNILINDSCSPSLNFKNVIIANDDNFTNALSATALAGRLDAPIVFYNKSLNISDLDKKDLLSLCKNTENYYLLGSTEDVPNDWSDVFK